jgi:hypothetical protein
MRSLYAGLALLVGLVGLGIDAWIIFPSLMSATPAQPEPRSFVDAFIYFWTYLTHLSNLGLVLVYLAELTGWRGLGWFRRPQTQAMLAGFITLVMVFYHVMLAPYLAMEGALGLASNLLHYAAPLAFLGWWALFAPHGSLRWRDLPSMLLPGLLYVAWVLVRGLWAREYPYAILDPTTSGYAGVAIGVGIILVAVSLLCALLIGLDGLLGRRRTAS